MPSPDLDRERLSQALALAQQAIGLSDPNPRVGCVIGTEEGELLGVGHTQHAGGPHAEVMALRDAQKQGLSVEGATAWVTLEPCAHHGRTPPCCEALSAAGLARVVIALQDPFPRVAGAGIAHLRAAGLQVDIAAHDLALQAWELNIGFFSRVLRARPWVRLKTAASLDGRTALPNGSSQWITQQAARNDGHAWRKRAQAVLSGIGTVLADDPRLDVRAIATALQPMRVVLDSQLRLPSHARVMAPPGTVLVVGARGDPARQQALQQAGAEVLLLPADDGRVDLPQLLDELAQRGVNELHIEAGATLGSALLRAGLVDELLHYLAPRLLGPGLGVFEAPALARLDDSLDFTLVETAPVGSDLRLRLRPARTPVFASPGSNASSGSFTGQLTPE